MFIPAKDHYTDMTPSEFEQYCLSSLHEQFQSENICDYTFKHNVIIEAHDGSYQIDGEIRFTIMGVEMIVLVECKKYKGPIKREHIQTLYSKIQSIGAHKGIFITTSYFQSGAFRYAKEHGIALISIVNGKLLYETRSKDCINSPIIPSWVKIKPFCMVMQTQITDMTISVSKIDDTDSLYRFMTDKL